MAPDWVVMLLTVATISLCVFTWRRLDALARADGPILGPLALCGLCMVLAVTVLILGLG